MRRTTLSVVLRVTFGLGGAAREYDKAEELSEVIGAYLEAIVATANEIPPLWQISPQLSSNYVAVTEKLLPRLRALVSDVIAQRRKEDLQGGGGVSSDLLSVLVREEGLSDEDIQYILFDLIIAGSDTTASTLTAALFLLHEVRSAPRQQARRACAPLTPLESSAGTIPMMQHSLSSHAVASRGLTQLGARGGGGQRRARRESRHYSDEAAILNRRCA